jgi:D-alanyl-D-alanine carboxypeptidase
MNFTTHKEIVLAIKDAKDNQDKQNIVRGVAKEYISTSLQNGISSIPIETENQDVKIIQSILAGLNLLKYNEMSGKLDQTTLLAIKKFAKGYNKNIDITKPLTKDIIDIFGEYKPEDLQYISKKERESSEKKYSKYTGDEYKYPPIPSDIKPLGISQAEKIYGHIEWERKNPNGDYVNVTNNFIKENIITIDIPQLSRIQHPESTRVSCHKIAAPYIKQLWQDWENAGLLYKIENFGGCVNIRTVRRKKGNKKGPTNTLSNHAFGTAFDINTLSNARGKIPPIRGQKGCLRELVPYAYKLGFWWGGYFTIPDGMHFELAKVNNQVLA